MLRTLSLLSVLVALTLSSTTLSAGHHKEGEVDKKLEAKLKAAFAKADKDKNKSLSEEELKASLPEKMQEKADKVFKKMDADKDGKVTVEEFVKARAANAKKKKKK